MSNAPCQHEKWRTDTQGTPPTLWQAVCIQCGLAGGWRGAPAGLYNAQQAMRATIAAEKAAHADAGNAP